MKTFRFSKAVLVVSILVFSASVVLLGASNATNGQTGSDVLMAQTDDAKDDEEKAKKAEEPKKVIKGSVKKGKYFFKKECKTCHDNKGDGGEITPISKTIKQWDRYFKKDKHGDKKLSEEFDAEQLIHIKTFLRNHAADSDQPETCG